MRKFIMTVLVLMGVLGVAHGANINYSGRVISDGGAGVDYATVVVMQVGGGVGSLAGDSTVVGSAFTGIDGGFNVNIADSVAGASLLLEVSCFRYEKLIIHSNSGTAGLPKEITLSQSTIKQDIEEVVVAGKKTSFTRQGDRYIFRISDELEIAKSSNVYDILKITPLVTADDQGSITIAGAGSPQVYINSRRSRLSGENLMFYLRSIPATNLSNIEVMPIANSTYAGDGQFSVIDIKLKKRLDDGVNGSANISSTQVHTNRQSLGLNLNIRKKKVAVNTSIWGQNIGRQKMVTENQTLFLESGNIRNSNERQFLAMAGAGGSITVDYDISDRQVLGVTLTGHYGEMWGQTNTTTSYGNNRYPTFDSIYSTAIKSNTYMTNMAANINYQLKTDSKGNLFTIDVDYLDYSTLGRQTTSFDRVTEDGSLMYTLDKMLQRLPQHNRAITGKAQYNYDLGRWGELSTGVDVQATTSDDNSYYASFEWDNKNETLSNHFVYTEIISSLFASYTTQWVPKFSSTIGARLEYDYTNAEQRTLGEQVKNFKLKLLPTLYLNYNINDDNILSYALSDRLTHPHYSKLNSFRTYSSPNSYSSGNPYLRPAKSLSQDLQYTFKGKLITRAEYSTTSDAPVSFTIPTPEGGTNTTTVNMGSSKEAALGVYMSGSYFDDRWYPNNGLSIWYSDQQGMVDNTPYHSYTTYFSFSMNNTVILSKKHKLQASLYYSLSLSSKSKEDYSYPTNIMGMSIKKGFGNFYVSLACDNIKLQKYNSISERTNNGVFYRNIVNTGFTSFSINVSYAFGDSSVRGARSRSTSGDDVKSRL